MGNAFRRLRGESQKNFAKLMEGLSDRHSRWTVWTDFVTMSAISISNTVDTVHREEREKMYLACAEKYSEKEMSVFPKLLFEVIAELDRNPNQDFLGELFMALDLGNEWKGQFFTPYSVCLAMSAMTFAEDVKERISKQGWISVSDPACGAGALLVAFANECLEHHINYQTDVLFVAQDIDFIAGCMCYIQLSLLGCPGYVVVDDSLCRPTTSHDSRGLIPCERDTIWYTPFYFRDVWHWRKVAAQMELLFSATAPEPENSVAEKSEEAEAPPVLEEVCYAEAKNGQLTLF